MWDQLRDCEPQHESLCPVRRKLSVLDSVIFLRIIQQNTVVIWLGLISQVLLVPHIFDSKNVSIQSKIRAQLWLFRLGRDFIRVSVLSMSCKLRSLKGIKDSSTRDVRDRSICSETIHVEFRISAVLNRPMKMGSHVAKSESSLCLHLLVTRTQNHRTFFRKGPIRLAGSSVKIPNMEDDVVLEK